MTEPEESSFSEEKEAKRLFALLGARLLTSARQKEEKFFASFFQKRRIWRVFGSAAGPDVSS
jgi:hypothetical protein